MLHCRWIRFHLVITSGINIIGGVTMESVYVLYDKRDGEVVFEGLYDECMNYLEEEMTFEDSHHIWIKEM